MPDGTRNECKTCVKRYVVENKDLRREWWATYSLTHKQEKSEYDRNRRAVRKDVLKEYLRHYYEAHKQEYSEKSRIYRSLNQERIAETKRVYRQQKAAMLKEIKAAFYQKHKSRLRAKNRDYYLSNAEAIKQKVYQYRTANRSAFYGWEARRNEALLLNGGSHTLEQWNTLKAECQFTCLRCGKSEPQITLTRDHVIPISKGGTDFIENIQPLCGSCNSIKHTTTTDYR